jgi:ferric-dicitrate binding protein FerR (iron transport regulator)
MSESKNLDVPEEEAVRRLLAGAGPRPDIPKEDLAAIREAAREAWLGRYGRPAPAETGRWWLGLAAAAALAVALGLAWWTKSPGPAPAAPPAVASIEVLTGSVRMWRPTGEGPVPLSPGALGRPLPAGTELETGEGRLALRMAGTASVRLDAGTRLRLASPGSIELARGAVYVDSGARPGGRVAVRTAAGLFEEVGTQFEVRLAGSATHLRVREGRVMLHHEKRAVQASAGEELVVRDGNLVRRPAAVYGPEWDWVLQTAPRLDIEGLKVRDFLAWVARETGWRNEFADPEAAALAGSTVLHGSIENLTPAEAPRVVLASCGLGHRVTGGRMTVFVADANR